MTEFSLCLSPELLERLQAIAAQKDQTVADCAQQALLDYVESWEDFSRTVTLLDNGEEERTVLRAVNE